MECYKKRGKKCMKLLSMVVFLLFFMGGYTITPAGEWNDKPIMCGDEAETFNAINAKDEELIFKATQITKIRSETGLAKNPVDLRMDMYVNPATGTYTIIEYHPSYESYCIVSFGEDFQVFIGGVQ